MLGSIGEYFVWWQLPLFVVLIAIIIGYVIWRRKQV